jgi:hypothetical protein
MEPLWNGLLLWLFFRLKKHAAALGNDIFSETGACCRFGRVDGEALTILALLAGFGFLLVHDLHMMNVINYRF